MSYQYVLPVGYVLSTFSLAKRVGYSFFGYRGHTDPAKDIQARLAIMKNAVVCARRRIVYGPGGNDPATLKIFMAPEFYFRGTEGAYSIGYLSEILEGMRELTKSPTYQDWLFVFGTALGRIDFGTHDEIYNVALVQRGGYAEADGVHEHLVDKEYVSAIDFVGPHYGNHKEWENVDQRLAFLGSQTRLITATQGANDPNKPVLNQGSELRGDGIMGSLGGKAVFEMDGITFGLEVCRDHLLGRLRCAPPAPGQNFVQVHLVTSAGAFIKEQHVCGTNGTVAFNVDGGKKSDLRVKTGPDKCGPSITGTSYAITGMGLRVNYDQYFGDTGEICIYPRQPVPSRRTAKPQPPPRPKNPPTRLGPPPTRPPPPVPPR